MWMVEIVALNISLRLFLWLVLVAHHSTLQSTCSLTWSGSPLTVIKPKSKVTTLANGQQTQKNTMNQSDLEALILSPARRASRETCANKARVGWFCFLLVEKVARVW